MKTRSDEIIHILTIAVNMLKEDKNILAKNDLIAGLEEKIKWLSREFSIEFDHDEMAKLIVEVIQIDQLVIQNAS